MATKLTREELRNLSLEEKVTYQRKLTAERQKRYKSTHREKCNAYSVAYTKTYRISHPEKYREQNIKNGKNSRKRFQEDVNKIELSKVVKEVLDEIINSIPSN